MTEAIAAILYVIATALVAAFQLALAGGAPWGELAMGGRYPGTLPVAIRIAEVFQVALLVGLAIVVGARAGLWLPGVEPASRWAVWVAVGISAVSLAMNTASRSHRERNLWTPVAAIMLASSLTVALVAG